MRSWIVGLAALFGATPAAAEVKAAASGSFVLEHSVEIAVPIAAAWETLRSPHKWWDPAHSYSGDAANFYLDTQATGCFCERTPKDKGSIEHARIVYIAPGRMIRMIGALGPLQAEAVVGTMTWKLDPAGEGATKFTLTYVVGGYMPKGGEALAPLVDKVLGIQVERLKATAEKAIAEKGGAPAPVSAKR